MSYLRPTCSDAAARVTNLSVSRLVPTFRHNDGQTEDATISTPNAFLTESARPSRLPSQRPIDRRWDESRGLVFSQRSNACKNLAHHLRRGTALASPIGQRRGYAMRKLNVGPVPVSPNPKGSAEQSARVYGSTLPDLELPDKPIDSPPSVSKGSKQERFEREVNQRDAKIEKLREKTAELESRNLELQREAEKLKNEKSSALNDTQKALQQVENAKESAVKQSERADAKYKELRQKLDAVYKEQSTFKEELTKEISAREKSLVKQKTKFDNQMRERTLLIDQKIAAANQHDADVKQSAKKTREWQEERSKELVLREDRTRKRKMERPDYNAYRHQYTTVHDERKFLEEQLKLIQKRLTREKDELDTVVRKAEGSDRMQTRSASTQLKDLEEQLGRVCKDLLEIDMRLLNRAHASQLKTKTVRFDDISLAASSMSATLYSTSINPLRSIKSRIQADIEDIGKQIDSASNATLREELVHQKDALFAELAALHSAIDLAFYDQSIQVLETLKSEPYSHKAVHMRTMDTRTMLARKAQAMYEKKDFTPYRVLLAERNALEKQANLEKQRALILEISGQHAEDERTLDEMIAQKIAHLVDQIQVKRAKMIGHYKTARAASKRAHPARPVPATTRAQELPVSRTAFPKTPSRRSPAMKPGYAAAEKRTAMKRLRALLLDTTTSLEPSTRAEKLHQYNSLQVEILDAAISLTKAKMIKAPVTKTDISGNEGRRRALGIYANKRAEAQLRLMHDMDVRTRLTPQQTIEAKKSLGIDPAQARAQTDPSELKKHGTMPLGNAEVSEEPAGKASNTDKVSEGTDRKMKSGGRTRFSRRAILPGFKTLRFAPSSPAQAIHTSPARRELHDNLLWPSSLRQIADRLQPNSGVSGPARATVLTDGQESETTHSTGAFFSAGTFTSERSSDFNAEVARDGNNAKSHAQAGSASPSSETPIQTTSYNNIINDEQEHSKTMAEPEEDTVLNFEIPLKDKRNALIASRKSTASFWKYSLYKNAAGQIPTRHYCTTFEQTEAQIANFLGEKVVGFDLEWEARKSKPGEDSNKRCVSLMQVAAEGKVALFHLALFKGGDSAEELLPPALRVFLENPDIIKTGVNIGGDATRLRNCFGVEMRGNIELSHLYKVVTYGETQPEKVNRGLYALANQVKEVLHLPLAKGEVRTSSWSKRLNVQQIEYAVSDAYAGLRLYHELERRRKAMVSKPPRPAFHELAVPLMLGGGKLAPSAARRLKEPAVPPEEVVEEAEPTEEPATLQEPDDVAASEESSDDFFDTAEDLEAFDAFVESQDAATAASLPEVTYPTLPPLEPASNYSSQSSSFSSSSNLPSDPLTAPPSTFPSTQAAAADAWVTTWQSQLPAAYSLRVSRPHLRAYHLWHHQGFSLQETAALLRKEPLALSTVVSYVAEVLQKEGLEFDEVRVKEIRARLPSSVRGRYGRLYAKGDGE